jgi:aminoglycoside phosphotransferase (APT) family kinase protein
VVARPRIGCPGATGRTGLVLTGPVALPAALTGWLGRVLPGQRMTGVRRLSGGYSNENLLISTDAASTDAASTDAASTGAGGRFVLRRYLRANRCSVEAALAARLAGIVPVPAVIAADAGGSEAGEPVLLSEFAAGVPLSQVLAGLPPGAGREAGELGHAAGVALAAAGTVRFAAPGFLAGPGLVPDPGDLPGGLPEFTEHCLAAVRPGLAGDALSAAERDGLRELARRSEPLLAAVAGARQLVHSDYNPKNLLVVRAPAGSWTVTAVLDWEFAFSGSPLTDIGNMLRFGSDLPAGFAEGFTAGYVAAGGALPDGWREISRAIDLYALADFLTRPAGHEIARKAVALIAGRIPR